MRTEISNNEDVLDLRDVIARFEELETMRDEMGKRKFAKSEEGEEFKRLEAFLEDCKGNGGDEQWRGDWYPVTCIRDSYFKEYAQDLAEDIGSINRYASWPNNYIDWDAASDALQSDYTSVEFDGTTYWVR